MDNTKFLTRCLQLANNARGKTSPNPLVGAVVVCKGSIIGEGYHHKAGEPHAEVMAINSVVNQSLLKESTIFCSLEPCSHFGKTPPCSHLIVEKGIKKVVIGCLDSNPQVAGNGVRYLESHGVEVILSENPAPFLELNKVFFTNINKHRPYITLKFAQSADGYIDFIRDAQLPAAQLSGPITAIYTHRLRAHHDGIMVSAKTFAMDRPRLNLRYFSGNPPRPIIVLGTSQSIDMAALRSLQVSPLLVGPVAIEGYDCIVCEPYNLDSWVPKLRACGIHSVLIEGGAKLLSSFLASGLVDEVHRYATPKVLNDGVRAPKLNLNLDHQIRLAEDLIDVYYG